jgi:hypothetical protein
MKRNRKKRVKKVSPSNNLKRMWIKRKGRVWVTAAR